MVCALRAKGRGIGSLLFVCAALWFTALAHAQNPYAFVPGTPPGGVGGACFTSFVGYLSPLTGGSQAVVCDPVAHVWTVLGGAASSGGGGAVNTQLVSGCGVEYTSGLMFTVGACNYTINGVAYSSAQTTVVLAAADPSNPRIDVIGVDNTGSVFSITGTPAASPAEPSVDPSTQIGLIFVTVPALSTTPQGITATVLYDENIEWTCASTANINCASTNNPYHLTKDIEATAAVLGNNFTLVKPAAGTVNLSTQNNLIFYIRSKGAWPTANGSGANGRRTLSLFWLNGSTQVGVPVVIADGAFGFSSSNITGYQQISIPISQFGAGSNLVTTLKAQVTGNAGTSSFGWYIDEVTLQSGTNAIVLGCPLMSFQGTWNSTKAYNPCDTVLSNGIGYVALIANTNVATTTTSTWSALAGLAQISMGVIGSLPACSATTKGVYFPTNSVYDSIVCDGATNNYFFHGHQVYPNTAGWTVGNGGTLDTTNGYPYFSAPNLAAVAISDVYQTAPAAPYVCTAMFLHDVSTAQPGSATANPIVGYGMLFRDSTGKIVTFQVGTDTAATVANEVQIATFKWTTDILFSAAYQSYEATADNIAGLDFLVRNPIWMRIGDDNTNLNFYWSIDGNHFKLFDSRLRTDFFASGPTQVGFLAYARAGSIEMAAPSFKCQ